MGQALHSTVVTKRQGTQSNTQACTAIITYSGIVCLYFFARVTVDGTNGNNLRLKQLVSLRNFIFVNFVFV